MLILGTVRRWKCTHKWDSERSDKKSERSPKKKRGAQPGNKNSHGGQAARCVVSESTWRNVRIDLTG